MSGLHDEHRKRMDEKVKTMGIDNMPEHEILEMLLFAVIPRGNTNEIAKELCEKFGGLGNVLTAEPEELTEIRGIGYRAAQFLTTLPQFTGAIERSLNFPQCKITNREMAKAYVKTFFFGKLTETFYLISLSSTGKIIGKSKISDGTTDEVHAYTRTVAEIALKNKAHSVILAHNHPGGTKNASVADVNFTNKVIEALKVLQIEVSDSLIVASGEVTSMFEEGYCKPNGHLR